MLRITSTASGCLSSRPIKTMSNQEGRAGYLRPDGNVGGAVSGLIDALSKTREFLELKKAAFAINQNNYYKTMLENFQKKQAQLQTPGFSQAQLEMLYSEIQTEYTNLANIPEFKLYFSVFENFDSIVSFVISSLYSALNSKL